MWFKQFVPQRIVVKNRLFATDFTEENLVDLEEVFFYIIFFCQLGGAVFAFEPSNSI